MKDYKDMQKRSGVDKAFKGADNSHYSEPSMYGKMVKEQYKMRDASCTPKGMNQGK